MKRLSQVSVWMVCVLITVSVLAQTPVEIRIAGQWKGNWATTPITLNLKLTDGAAKKGSKANVAGNLSLGEVTDPLAAKDGPKTVTPTSEVTGTIDAKGAIELVLTFPDLEGRSQPETFTGTIETDKATRQDTLVLQSKDNKARLTLKHP